MSNLNKAQIVKIFTNNIGSYIGYGDIQEVITGITFLFWNAKYIDKKLRPEIQNQNDLVYYLDDKSGINSAIGKEILDAYFELKTNRSNANSIPVEQPNKAQ